jgi:hypothetical protein
MSNHNGKNGGSSLASPMPIVISSSKRSFWLQKTITERVKVYKIPTGYKGRVICYVVPELIPVAFCTSRPCTLVPLLFVHRSNRICTSVISQIMFIGSKNPLILGQNPQQQFVTYMPCCGSGITMIFGSG